MPPRMRHGVRLSDAHLWPADADARLLRVEVHAAVCAVQQVRVLIGVPDHVAAHQARCHHALRDHTADKIRATLWAKQRGEMPHIVTLL